MRCPRCRTRPRAAGRRGRGWCRLRRRAGPPQRKPPPGAGPRSRARRCRWSCKLLLRFEFAEPRPKAGKQLCDLLLLKATQLGEQPRDVRVSFLRGLELEDAIARTKLEVQRQSRQ